MGLQGFRACRLGSGFQAFRMLGSRLWGLGFRDSGFDVLSLGVFFAACRLSVFTGGWACSLQSIQTTDPKQAWTLNPDDSKP